MVERLSGKAAIVTGAASRGEGVGNGAATAIWVVLINRNADRAKSLEERIGQRVVKQQHSSRMSPNPMRSRLWQRSPSNATAALTSCTTT